MTSLANDQQRRALAYTPEASFPTVVPILAEHGWLAAASHQSDGSGDYNATAAVACVGRHYQTMLHEVAGIAENQPHAAAFPNEFIRVAPRIIWLAPRH